MRCTALPRRIVSALLVFPVLLGMQACAGERAAVELVVATTTSVEDSGLMEFLAGELRESRPRLRLRVVAVGSGEALAMGRRGDADVLLTHAPDDEARFVRDGHGERSTPVMHNRFVLVGPPVDPAGVRGASSVGEALRRIRETRSPFLTRGDGSGTHVKELALWAAATPTPPVAGNDDWYFEAGLGMGDLLRLAAERAAYTLTDEASFVMNVRREELVTVYDGDDAELRNPYAVTPVTGARHPEAARVFHDWLVGPDGQAAIAAYGAGSTGPRLFTPASRS